MPGSDTLIPEQLIQIDKADLDQLFCECLTIEAVYTKCPYLILEVTVANESELISHVREIFEGQDRFRLKSLTLDF